MSRISVHSTARRARRAFTLTEVLVATTLSAMVFAAVFGAYLFLGRNLTRLVSLQRQEVESRRTLRQFTADLSAAIQLTTATPTQLVLTKPASSGTTTVSYLYSASEGTLRRAIGSDTQTLASGVTELRFDYFNGSGSATSNVQNIKGVELVLATAMGNAASGTLARATTVSPRILLRNKPALE